MCPKQSKDHKGKATKRVPKGAQVDQKGVKTEAKPVERASKGTSCGNDRKTV
jgi:hypothetical protein